jgi:hypothetical protein
LLGSGPPNGGPVVVTFRRQELRVVRDHLVHCAARGECRRGDPRIGIVIGAERGLAWRRIEPRRQLGGARLRVRGLQVSLDRRAIGVEHK